jgi:hypothetical protein
LVLAVGLLIIGIGAAVILKRAEPILRARVIETLSARFKGPVELSEFHVSLSHGVQVQGGGLKIYGEQDPNIHKPGIQPLIEIASFTFQTRILELMRSPMRIESINLKGLLLNLPPKEQRQAGPGAMLRKAKAKIEVHHFACEEATLIINTSRLDKLPLKFDITDLKMTSDHPGQPLHFEAKLINPKPVGNIATHGLFGPWQPDSPRDTVISGEYSFTNADLSTINGIGGMLSSNGMYKGTLDRIVVDGKTSTPDFRVATSGRPVPLETVFHAIVDGTTGDTTLQPVQAKLLNSLISASGSIMKVKEAQGHHIQLDVSIEKARIEDLLALGVKTDPPIMTGAVRLKTKLDLPPGEADVPMRLRLAGTFAISGVHFTNPKVQAKVDNLSMRSQGKPKLAKDDIPDNVPSDMSGKFQLRKGVLSFSQLYFQAPGTLVSLSGDYSLDGNRFDFHGKARLKAKLSHLVTGWKSLLLKPVDPFFHKHGAGTEIGVQITGTKSAPHFGVNLGGND